MPSVLALPAQSYVYVIGDPTGPQKVGFAADPRRRLALFRTGNMGDLRIAIAAPISRELVREAERCAHWFLRDYHARGEWFSVSPEEACAAVEQAVEAVLAGKVAPDPGFGGGGRRKINFEEMPGRFGRGTFARIDRLLQKRGEQVGLHSHSCSERVA